MVYMKENEENKNKAKKKQQNKKALATAIFFLVASVAFTLIIRKVDVNTIGPEKSSVGLSSINMSVSNLFGGFNNFWYELTEKTALLLALPVFGFALLGLIELIKRKSFKKIDKELFVLTGFYIVVALTYIFFEKIFIVNYRPVLIDGELEASYPSSHTLFAFCICCSAIYIINRLLRPNHKTYAMILNALLAVILMVNVFGRLLSGAHWFTDIFGGVLISAALVAFFKYSLDFCESKEKKQTKELPKKKAEVA